MTARIRRYSIIIACICLMLALSIFCDLKGSRAYGASTGKVTSVSNTAGGIQIKWSKDTSRDGYYIYRKAGTGKWYKVQTVNRNSITSWTDKKAKNGKKYSYRVRGFNGSSVSKNTVSKTIYRLTKPKVKELNTPDAKSLEILSSSNSEATGYQIRYSRSSSFKSYKSATVTGTKAKKLLESLAADTYYVKVRAYKKVKSTKYYSAWSDVSSKWVFQYVYTINQWTSLNKGMKYGEDDAVRVWYRTKLKDLGVAKSTSSGDWRKLKYSGSTYYIWVTKDSPKVTSKAPKTNYSSSYKLRNEVLKKALSIYNNWKTKYDHTGVADNDEVDENGRHAFDCSGFTSYVLNTVMQKYCPAYRVTRGIKAQAEIDVIINEGFPQELKTVTVCKKLNFDKLSPGDLIFFNTDDDEYADHVGIYLGNKEFIHSTANYIRNPNDYLEDGKATGGVCISPLGEQYSNDFMVAKRFVPDDTDNLKIDKKLVAIKKINKVYSDYKCNDSLVIEGESILKDEVVTLLYTKKVENTGNPYVTAYVQYGDKKYGWIYKYDEKFEDYVEPPEDPEEPEEPR
ncbi:MAG: C40 family peptidase [Firmicutes bacterium]|nr:C40 family peptidase [Bacillota bacterium]